MSAFQPLALRWFLAAIAVCMMASACRPASTGDRPSADNSSKDGPATSSVPSVVRTAIFPDLRLADVLNGALPGQLSDDRNLLLGGVGSDLWRSPDDPPNELWLVTDRGPNGRIRESNRERRTFPLPDYTPMILRVRLEGTSVAILNVIPIVGQSGRPVTGLPNLDGHDEPGYDYTGKEKLPFNPSGIDSEGLVRAPSGEFWIVDEYGPSLLRVSADGRVLKRYLPAGVKLDGADYPVAGSLPAIYALRADNGGFEGVALSPDGRTLYLATQSPLENPDKQSGEGSRNTRILAFDIVDEKPTAEYVYRFDRVGDFDPSEKGEPGEMKISGLTALGPDALITIERTDSVAKLYRVQISQATNILGTIWDDPATRRSMEAIDDLGSLGVSVLRKSLVADLSRMRGVPDKIEGLARLDDTTLVVSNDNDFDIGKFDKNGRNVGQGHKTRFLTISLPGPLR